MPTPTFLPSVIQIHASEYADPEKAADRRPAWEALALLPDGWMRAFPRDAAGNPAGLLAIEELIDDFVRERVPPHEHCFLQWNADTGVLSIAGKAKGNSLVLWRRPEP